MQEIKGIRRKYITMNFGSKVGAVQRSKEEEVSNPDYCEHRIDSAA